MLTYLCRGTCDGSPVQAHFVGSPVQGTCDSLVWCSTIVIHESLLNALYVDTPVQGNWLRSVGVKKGDAVAIYMPMVCELPIAMLACARIGAVHSIIFGGFSAESLAQRMENCK